MTARRFGLELHVTDHAGDQVVLRPWGDLGGLAVEAHGPEGKSNPVLLTRAQARQLRDTVEAHVVGGPAQDFPPVTITDIGAGAITLGRSTAGRLFVGVTDEGWESGAWSGVAVTLLVADPDARELLGFLLAGY